MELIGKWKVREVMSFDLDSGMVWKTLDQLAASENADEDSIDKYRKTVMDFNGDGTVETLMPVPEDFTQEQRAQLEDEGIKIRDGMAVISVEQWKCEDGKNLYNTGISGEVLGEEVSSWTEINEVGDMIEIALMRLERI